MVGTTSMTWWNCERGVASGLICLGQETAIGCRVPPKWAATSLVDLYGVEPAQLFDCLDVLVDLRGNAVLGEQLGDGAVLALGRRPVVAPDVEDEGVVELPLPLDLVDDL